MFNAGKFVASLLLTGLAAVPALIVTRMKWFKNLSKLWRYVVGGVLVAIPVVVAWTTMGAAFKEGPTKMRDIKVSRTGPDGEQVETTPKQAKAEQTVSRLERRENLMLTRGLPPRERRDARRDFARQAYMARYAA